MEASISKLAISFFNSSFVFLKLFFWFSFLDLFLDFYFTSSLFYLVLIEFKIHFCYVARIFGRSFKKLFSMVISELYYNCL
jgi:hypothetical protein